MKEFKLYYSVDNCGDGSAYPRFFLTEKEADDHQESLEEGWGESCTGSITLTIVDDNVCFKDLVWDENIRKYEYVIKKLMEVI